MIVKTIKTNKAVIEILDDNTVLKTFNNRVQAEKEFKSLNTLHEIFDKVHVNDWSLETVKPLKLEDKTITMTKAQGVMLEDVLYKDRNVYLSGVWLAKFHDKCMDAGMVKRIDYNRKNIIIDGSTKTLTVIDPGALLFRDCEVEFSILDTVVGLVIGAMEQRVNPKPIIKSFIQGYFSTSNNNFNTLDLSEELNEVINARHRIQKQKNKNNFISWLQLQVIKIYVRIIGFPIILKQ